MNKTIMLLLLVMATTVIANPHYPASPRVEQSDQHFGQTVKDPYRWLEDLTTAQTSNWATAQNLFTQNILDKQQIAATEARLMKYTNFQSMRRFATFGGNRFYLKGWAGTPTAALFVELGEGGSPRRIAGPDLSEPSVKQGTLVNAFWPSPDGKHVVALQSAVGDSWGSVSLIEVATGKVLKVIDKDIAVGLTQVSWSQRESRFLITRYEPDSKGQRPINAVVQLFSVSNKRLKTVYRPNADEDRAKLILSPVMLNQSSQFVVHLRSGSAPTNRVLLLDLNKPVKPPQKIFADANANRLFLGNRGKSLWFYSDEDAVNGKVIKLEADSPKQSKVVVAQTDNPISANSSVGGNALGMFGQRIVLTYLEAGRYFVRGFDLNGKRVYQFDVPPTGSIWGGFSGEPNQNSFHYSFLGISEPSSIYRVDGKGKRKLVAKPKLPFDMDIVATRVYVNSSDEAMIPVIIAHRKDLDLRSPKPLMQYGYGGFGWVSFLWYQAHLMDWFANDGVFVVAGVRGGGEYGTPWREAGIKHNRQNAINDYIATSKWLIDNGYTDARQLVANGGSFSGSLAAAAVLQQPDLYGASIIDYPILDMVRFSEFGRARYWLAELGDPTVEADFKALMAYSPYHKLDSQRCLPPTLVRTGEFDSTVTPMHGYKFVASAQHWSQCKKPVLLDIMEGAGHDYGSTPRQIAHSHAVALTFLQKQIGMKGGK